MLSFLSRISSIRSDYRLVCLVKLQIQTSYENDRMPALSISDKFALDLIFIIKEHLCENNYCREQLELQILLTLSKNIYINQLLFRDLSASRDEVIHNIGGERIHDQAITYLYQVLGRRLRLARNLIAKPSNMHQLLANLCRYSTGKIEWTKLNIMRHKGIPKSPIDDEVLWRVNETLEKQISLLGENYSDESLRRRDQFGPLYLMVDKYFLELPEEMSFFDVIEAVPKHLRPDFITTTDVRNSMIRVIKSLNERYMLIRSCGFDINQLLENSELSISNLRDMKQMKSIAEYLLKKGEAPSSLAAYHQAFKHLKESKSKVAACKNFEDFILTKHGSQLMNLLTSSQKTSPNNESFSQQNTHELKGDEGFEDTVIVQLDSRRRVKQMLSHDTHGIDDVMKMVFNEIISHNRSLFNKHDKNSLLYCNKFKKLTKALPEYRELSNLELVQKIYHNAEIIIAEKLQNNMGNKKFKL